MADDYGFLARVLDLLVLGKPRAGRKKMSPGAMCASFVIVT